MREGLLKGLLMVLVSSCVSTATSSGEASLGQVHFANTCKPQVQTRFFEGVALLHSFEFPEAEQAFGRVETEDPKCVIAAWGMALSKTQRSGAGAPQKDLAAGWGQLQPWLAVKAGSEREQMYMDAVHAMYEGYDKIPANVREQKYLAHMDEIRRKYPEDINASLFYAIGLAFNAGSGREGLKHRRQALAILLPIFQKYPQNPGAAHYIIHAADTAELASQALPAARKYAAIAPDSPHALHMPSHIFNRLGLWQDSILTNEASARVASEWVKAGRDGMGDEFHALNNIEYAALQLGDDQKAKAAVAEITALSQNQNQADLWLSVDARIYYDIETHDWQDATKIEPPPGSAFEENFDAYWIESIGAARSGDPIRARAAFIKYRDSEMAWNKSHGWGDILGVGLAEAEAWTLFSEGKRQEAVAKLRSMAEFERNHPMYYADILPRPTGEMLGDMLSEMERPTEALAAYQTALHLAPNRLDSLLGAMKAAASIGNVQLIDDYVKKIHSEGGRIAVRP